MTEFEINLKNTLEEFQSVLDSGAKENLSEILQRIQQLTEATPPDTHPQLVHYLQKRSYQKAIQWLNGEDPER